MASMSTQTPNSFNPSTSKSPNHKYDVFLSFRGADVRDNFLENLYRALCQKGISTFKDDDKLEDGERINDGLLKAIEESKFAIVVLSKNYADSSWCLRELVHILKCKKDNGLVVYPIFYRVSPSDVRGQKRSFGEAFAKLTESNEDEVKKWMEPLKEVGELKGWAYPNDKFETEASLIDDLVGTIFNKSSGTYGVLAEDLVGISYNKLRESPDAVNEETKEFQRLIGHALRYAKGVPLALKVLGSFLSDKTVPEWECALDRLRESSDVEAQRVLRISYDGLQWTEKKIFLDIACFFTGGNKYGICKNRVINILNSCGFNPVIGISVLVKKSLLTISEDNYLKMHDLVQQMGRSIVDEESREEPGERSRLWRHEDIKYVLVENTGTNKVEGISYRDYETIHLRPDAFAKMIDLRFLEVRATFCSIELPNNLRCLIWNEYPLRSMPSTFQPKHLVELHLIRSRIEQLWDTTMVLPKLTGMNLSYSMSLINSPEFTSFPNLEYLDLNYCTALVNLHPSIGKLKNLQRLNLNGCPIDWERGENKQGRNASLGEVESLSNLHTLHIQIKDPIALTGSLLFRNLKKYQIQIGDGYVNNFGSYDKCCSIHHSMPIPLEGNIQFLMKNSEELMLRGEFTKDLMHGLVQDGSRSLKSLVVRDIDSLEYLANAEATLLLPSVESLHLRNLGNLKQLSHSPLMGGSCFENLKNLYVGYCGKLKNLFQLSVATEFMHLKKIVIKDCKSMEEVIWKEHKEDETNKLAFPKLKNLEIKFLPSLVSFFRGIDEVEFPQLKSMSLGYLPKVQIIVKK